MLNRETARQVVVVSLEGFEGVERPMRALFSCPGRIPPGTRPDEAWEACGRVCGAEKLSRKKEGVFQRNTDSKPKVTNLG